MQGGEVSEARHIEELMHTFDMIDVAFTSFYTAELTFHLFSKW